MVLTSTSGQSNLPLWFPSVFAIVSRIERGVMEFALPDGRVFRAEGKADLPGVPVARIDVCQPQLFARMVREGDLGFAEAYVDGWWDSPDLQAVLDVALINNDTVGRGFPGAKLARMIERIRHWMNRNTRSGSERNISAHYDLGNEFYALWLDPSMTYSAARFRNPDEPLEEAQKAKYASICDRMGLSEGDHVLEIGCGWGGFAEYAAAERGARVTGLTLSREQFDFAQKRLFDKGLAERAEIVLRDYRDEQGSYDGVASIEMFEAVGEQYWPLYFNTVRERLKPGARASLQIITISDQWFDGYRKSVDFVQKHIFPGGALPSPSALRSVVAEAGLEWIDSVEFGWSYSHTLRRWRQSFNEAWDDVATLGFDERFRRMWNFYLVSCAACFLSGTTDVTQIALRGRA